MTGSTEGGAPDVGEWIDESAVAPSPKAHHSPLRRDRMRFQIKAHGVSVAGEVNVGRGLHDATNYAVVCGVASGTAVLAVALCLVCRASGWITLGAAAVGFVLPLTAGLAYISVRSSRDWRAGAPDGRAGPDSHVER